jgi:hypothetical protein
VTFLARSVPPYPDQLLVLWPFLWLIPELDIIVVNLSLPIGWTGSPVTYSIAGQAIKAIHNSHPGFHSLVYCDDHIMFGHSGRFEMLMSDIYLR